MIFLSIAVYYLLIVGLPLTVAALLFRKQFRIAYQAIGRYFTEWVRRDRLQEELRQREEEASKQGREKAEHELERDIGGSLTRLTDFVEGHLPPTDRADDTRRQPQEKRD